ncbi:cell wall metabolism sensor histidine kinase WalK [Aquibacillus salsiterrae]|uniref:histidine kinase n=1 Tax=Aquibacillus salsiterrae TaxID=2950439 RepID=A0A9X4AFX8_9BACI|nr:cell wall metabolism sensor histidine kinase WalK [Aquibacillus salsiterrae]MDC3418492.1 cell wall metabolism sensor histidine kinase WalK [Aquibacillus salsiterrae]
MKKVSFFQSIRFKFIVILILLLLLAIQVIGAYFAQKLQTNLEENFTNNVEQRLQDLTYYLEETFKKDRDEAEQIPSLQQEVQSILTLYDSELYSDLQVIDTQSRVIGANSQLDRVGKRITGESGVTLALNFGQDRKQILRDPYTGNRMLVRIIPLFNGDTVVGAIKLEASMEDVYAQVQSINKIFLNGTILAIIVSAILGILVARTITKPITEMRKQAMIMSTGDFSQKVNVYGLDEIGQLASTFNDMNDKLKQAHVTTEGERRKLSSVLSNMSDGVIATDETGAITLMNESAADLMDKSFDELKGQQLIEVLQLDEKVDDLFDLQEAGSMIIDFSDDEQFYLIKANFSVIQDENEQITGFITVISDVTEQEKAERERREFVSNVSHELRTPLTTMRSYLEALTDGAWENKEIAPKFLDVTQNETERMIRLVNDLLQLSKMDHKEQTIYKERVNIMPFFHHILDRFEMNKKENIVIERQMPKENVFLWIDKDKITQVVDNIISNAIKYSPEGGTIKFKVVKEKQRILVSISDQGMGIAREKLDKIFERFYRADRARSRELGGTGLGLAIAKEIIDFHHGHIWAESKEGKGTTILFTLPLIKKKRGGR